MPDTMRQPPSLPGQWARYAVCNAFGPSQLPAAIAGVPVVSGNTGIPAPLSFRNLSGCRQGVGASSPVSQVAAT